MEVVFFNFVKNFKLNFKSSKLRDNKIPDAVIRINNEYYIVEHKLTNGSGGSQNAEINEIIKFKQ